MQRQLLIMRHAKAEELHGEQTDRNRELTAKGQQDALQMGAHLLKRNIMPDVIHASVAARTQQTAYLLSDVLKIQNECVYLQEELYNSAIRSYVNFIMTLENNLNCVLMVGHNPTVSYLAEYLTGSEIGSMPTSGICILQINGAWNEITKGCAELSEYIYPKMSE
jgi:phosphohistidine phosphatase